MDIILFLALVSFLLMVMSWLMLPTGSGEQSDGSEYRGTLGVGLPHSDPR